MSTLLAATPTEGPVIPCASDPELWFAERTAEVERAKALCGTCPVRRECLAGALERREPWGVWGGELIELGTVVPRKRQRGRPRKSDALLQPAARTGSARELAPSPR